MVLRSANKIFLFNFNLSREYDSDYVEKQPNNTKEINLKVGPFGPF